MKNLGKIKAIAVFAVLLISLIASADCAEAKQKLKISKQSSQICVGQVSRLKVSGTKKKIKWKSSNKKLATIKSNGVITGKKKGTVTFTAQAGNEKVKCRIRIVDHNYMEATCTEAKICLRCGKKSGNALGHDYNEVTCEKDAACRRCGVVIERATGHDYDEATCLTDAVCRKCGEVIKPALGHDYDEATCLTDAVCRRCGVVVEPALGHDYEETTCEKGTVCRRCGDILGPAIGHDYDRIACEKDAVCHRCGKLIQRATGHDWQEATCEKPKTCRTCGKTEGTALGHAYTPATCTEPETCTRCGETTNVLPLGHSGPDTSLSVNGTVGNLESASYTCTRCNTPIELTGSDIPLKIRFQYHSTAGFTGKDESVLRSVYSILDSIIKDGMSDRDKVKAIHDYLIYHADYYNNGDYSDAPDWAYAVEGVIQRGEGVCQSYALAFCLMCICEDIPCRYIVGIATNSPGNTAGHGWNQVCVDGIWYYIDCTWDDPAGGGYECYWYYLSETLWDDHIVRDIKNVDDDSIYWKWYLSE